MVVWDRAVDLAEYDWIALVGLGNGGAKEGTKERSEGVRSLEILRVGSTTLIWHVGCCGG